MTDFTVISFRNSFHWNRSERTDIVDISFLGRKISAKGTANFYGIAFAGFCTNPTGSRCTIPKLANATLDPLRCFITAIPTLNSSTCRGASNMSRDFWCYLTRKVFVSSALFEALNVKVLVQGRKSLVSPDKASIAIWSAYKYAFIFMHLYIFQASNTCLWSEIFSVLMVVSSHSVWEAWMGNIFIWRNLNFVNEWAARDGERTMKNSWCLKNIAFNFLSWNSVICHGVGFFLYTKNLISQV